MESINNVDQQKLLDKINEVRSKALLLEKNFEHQLNAVCPESRESARNLIHYMALRQVDMGEVQEQLAQLGMTRLAKAEAHVAASLNALGNSLQALFPEASFQEMAAISFEDSRKELDERIEDLLGASTPGRRSRILVTLPSEAARDAELIEDLMQKGTNAFRINCAHDTEKDWKKMIGHIRKSEKKLNTKVKITMDLAGPKLRTGPTKTGPKMKVFKPKKDVFGKILEPLQLWIYPEGTPSLKAEKISFPVDEKFFSELEAGDKIRFFDTRNKKRSIRITSKEIRGAWGALNKNSYITSGTQLKIKKRKLSGTFGEVPAVEVPIILHKGETLILHKEEVPGESAKVKGKNGEVQSAHISLTLPEVYKNVKPGELIKLDDGKIEGKIAQVSPDKLEVVITYALETGGKLKSDKGINLPESDLKLSGLTQKDKKDLVFVVKHADAVNMSFVNTPEDVEEMVSLLESHGNKQCGLVLKIETQTSYQRLPSLLLEAMKWPKVGVMIARGDLAVEMGWKRLAEVQEEILWLCLAAHVPNIWATQVLESLAKTGNPSRAEITDAAAAQRADCVMLNKGPYILETVEMLDDILRSMQVHQVKKKPLLAKLRVAEQFQVEQ